MSPTHPAHGKIGLLEPADMLQAEGLMLDCAQIQRTLREVGLPQIRRHEAWKYSNPSVLIEQARAGTEPCIKVANEVPHRVPTDDLQARRLFQEHVMTGLDFRRLPMAAVVLSCLQSFAVIRVPSGGKGKIQIQGTGKNGASAILVVLEPGASAELEETEAARSAVIACVLKERSKLCHLRLHPASREREYSLLSVGVGTNAEYQLRQFSRGGLLRRSDVWIRMEGKHAHCAILGGWRLGAGERLDTQIVVDHEAPDTFSSQRFHGAVADGGVSVFGGRIWIAPEAARSDAGLINRNLVDGSDSQAYTKPELEIYTDDVKCSHGATVGQIESDPLFYLQSRGVSRARAAALLAEAFLREIAHDDREQRLLGL